MTDKLDAIYGAAAGGGKFDPLWDDFLRVRKQRDLLLAACKAVIREANSGEWHSDVDCEIEGRQNSCRLCETIREAQAAIALAAATEEA